MKICLTVKHCYHKADGVEKVHISYLKCILKCLYEDMFESSVVKHNDKLNWTCKVRDILFKYGFHNIWISQYVNHVDFFICEFKQRMKDNFISEMNTFFNKSPKCH